MLVGHRNHSSISISFFLWGVKLHTLHFIWYHKHKAEKNGFPGPAVYTLDNTVGLHVCKVRMSTCDQLVVHLRPQFLFCEAAFNSFGAQPVLLHFTAVFDVLPEVPICPFLQTVKPPMNSPLMYCLMYTPTWPCWANIPREDSIPSSRLLISTLNSICSIASSQHDLYH